MKLPDSNTVPLAGVADEHFVVLQTSLDASCKTQKKLKRRRWIFYGEG
jgi:hypothetical protein